jgi:hypothetical protein
VIRLAFNHPVKELIWCYQNPSPVTNRNAMWNFSTSVSNVNVTVDPAVLGGSYTGFGTNYVGCPILYTPGPYASNLTVTATTGSVISGTTILTDSSIAVRSNIVSGNAFWVEAGLPNGGVANTKAGYEVGPLHKFKIMLNGTDRFNEQMGKYFNQYQPYQHHSGHPYPGIYVYSFALKPEELQPSGACNFSRIDMAQVAVSLKTGAPSNLLQKMFAVNYNVLRIQSGMGGLAFSN